MLCFTDKFGNQSKKQTPELQMAGLNAKIPLHWAVSESEKAEYEGKAKAELKIRKEQWKALQENVSLERSP